MIYLCSTCSVTEIEKWTPSKNNRWNYFLNISLCNFGTIYVRKYIGSNFSLIRSLLDLFSRYQVIHQVALQIYVIILAIHLKKEISDVDIEFLYLYVNMPFII